MLIVVIYFPFVSVADRSDDDGGSVLQRAAPHTPAQKFNELLGRSPPSQMDVQQRTPKTPCMCGVFLSSQINKGAGKQNQPVGYAALIHEHDDPAPCNALGVKACANKCLEIVSFLFDEAPNYNTFSDFMNLSFKCEYFIVCKTSFP